MNNRAKKSIAKQAYKTWQITFIMGWKMLSRRGTCGEMTPSRPITNTRPAFHDPLFIHVSVSEHGAQPCIKA